MNAPHRRISLTLFAILHFSICLVSFAQPSQPLPLTPEQLQQLASAREWNQLVLLLKPITARTAHEDYYFGEALAQLGRFSEAQKSFQAGQRLAPSDSRFPTELAGIAFRQKNYAQTIRLLRQAHRLAPTDAYTNDFLGTAYFLEGNFQASLKYWNRVGKPKIANVREVPETRISPALLDSAFAFSPAATLPLPQLLNSEVRLRGLGVFPQFHIELSARPDGSFDALLQNQENNGFGDTKLEAILLSLQGLPFQEVNPQFYNFHRQAINFDSMFRWDAQKRRIFADFSGPLEHSAKYRWISINDLRNENWAIRNGPAPVLASFNMRRESSAFSFASHAGDRLQWSAAAELSHRDFRSVVPTISTTPVLTAQMLASGYQLKQQTEISSTLWRIPERRFAVAASAAVQAARLWSQPQQAFEKLTGSAGWHWFPQLKGDDYETSQQFRAGRTFGQPPFDELFILGLERDNDLPLRAHIGTQGGRKGSAPLGRNYLLENWDLDKNLYSNGLVRVTLGPFLDIGKISDPRTQLGSRQWLFDTGMQAKFRVLGVGLVFSYGRDLRTGNNAFYLNFLSFTFTTDRQAH